jgi:hypothetical protein
MRTNLDVKTTHLRNSSAISSAPNRSCRKKNALDLEPGFRLFGNQARRSRMVLKSVNALQCAVIPFGFNGPAIPIVQDNVEGWLFHSEAPSFFRTQLKHTQFALKSNTLVLLNCALHPILQFTISFRSEASKKYADWKALWVVEGVEQK